MNDLANRLFSTEGDQTVGMFSIAVYTIQPNSFLISVLFYMCEYLLPDLI